MEPQNNIHVAGVADPVAAGTHLVAFAGMLAGFAALRRRTKDRPFERLLVTVFGATTLAQYAASIAYHVSEHDPFLRRLDHASIYILIAGTFTPLAGAQLDGWTRATILTATWAFATCGVVLKLFFFGVTSEAVDTTFYLAAGWFGIVPVFFIWRNGERRTTAWIMTGALFYTAGALCELFGWPRIIPRVFNFHEVFHLCVMAAGAAFYVAVWRSVDDRIVTARLGRT